jgi:hypothetical protein
LAKLFKQNQKIFSIFNISNSKFYSRAADATPQLVAEPSNQSAGGQPKNLTQPHIPIAIASPPRLKFTIRNLGADPNPPIPGFGPLAYSHRPLPAAEILAKFGGPQNGLEAGKKPTNPLELEKRSETPNEYGEEVSAPLGGGQANGGGNNNGPNAAIYAGNAASKEKSKACETPAPEIAPSVPSTSNNQAEVAPASVGETYGGGGALPQPASVPASSQPSAPQPAAPSSPIRKFFIPPNSVKDDNLDLFSFFKHNFNPIFVQFFTTFSKLS